MSILYTSVSVAAGGGRGGGGGEGGEIVLRRLWRCLSEDLWYLDCRSSSFLRSRFSCLSFLVSAMVRDNLKWPD